MLGSKSVVLPQFDIRLLQIPVTWMGRGFLDCFVETDHRNATGYVPFMQPVTCDKMHRALKKGKQSGKRD